jgi:ribose/xylose/arabinose/galactoside ABC-type transport system permease subunit
MQRRSSDLVVQAVLAGVICVSATLALILGDLDPAAVSALYAAVVGYVFGTGNGVRIARKDDYPGSEGVERRSG